MSLTALSSMPSGRSLIDSLQSRLVNGLLDASLAAEPIDTAAFSFPDFLPHTSPPAWVWDWPHQRYLYEFLQGVTDGIIKKLIISLPPRHTKTETITVRYPVYRMKRDGTLRVALGCYNQKQANKFSRKARTVARMVGLSLSDERSSTEEWETWAGGGLQARGVGSGVTGNGYDLIIIDDPVKSREEAESEAYRNRVWDWYTDDIYTRLEPGGAIIVVMTRWHDDDLVGRILNSEDGAQWTVVNLPAIAEVGDPLGRAEGAALCPDRYDEAALLDRKRVLGSYSFNALYQGHPGPPEGTLINRNWWKRYTMCPTFERLVASWDCTFKDHRDADYVVGQVWGVVGADFYLVDQVRGRMGFAATKQAIIDQRNRWPMLEAIYIEDKANGTAVIESLRHSIPGIVAVEPEGGKVARAQAITPVIEAGNVYVPEGVDWAGDFIEECANFPNGAHDDQVDAMTQALIRLLRYEKKPAPAMTPRAPVINLRAQFSHRR